jgi:Spy/CpxP family protein refolding chaperone|tara:strand:- start:6937 stop:7203 length:267 start_codon:yes stop_codon:yes gene_type:complete
MSIQKKTVGATLATAAAALFIAGAAMTVAPTAAQAEGVKCMGANSCKGHGSCKTASNECKGHNACKGKGWVSTKSEKECMEMGGTVAK